MKYILNPTPVRTSNNFGINDITIDFKIPKANKFDKMSIEDNKDLEIKIDEDAKTISNRIGLEIESNKNIYIKVPEGKIIKETVRLLFKLESNSLIDNVFIDVGKNSKVKLLFAYEGTGFHFLKQEVHVHEYANAHITISNMLDNKSMSFIAIENNLEDNSKLKHSLVEFGGRNRISNYHSIQSGFDTENNVDTIYLGGKDEVIDINYLIEQFGKKSKCNVRVQGALNDNAKKHFKGFIDFKEGCTKSIGKENENCTLLSDKAVSRSLPVLLCHEEDVEGAHGVSTGKIDEKKLFYIMTKGIPYEAAKKLIVKANFSSIIKGIPNDNCQSLIMKRVDEI